MNEEIKNEELKEEVKEQKPKRKRTVKKDATVKEKPKRTVKKKIKEVIKEAVKEEVKESQEENVRELPNYVWCVAERVGIDCKDAWCTLVKCKVSNWEAYYKGDNNDILELNAIIETDNGTKSFPLNSICFEDIKSATAYLIHSLSTRYSWDIETFIYLLNWITETKGDLNALIKDNTISLGLYITELLNTQAACNTEVLRILSYLVKQYILITQEEN